VFSFLAIGLIGELSKLRAQGNDLNPLAGHWSGYCEYATMYPYRDLRTLNRIVRPVDAHSLEVLQWVEGGNTYDHPKIDDVLGRPIQFIVSRKTGLTFESKTPPSTPDYGLGATKYWATVSFSPQGGTLAMELSAEDAGDTCFGKSYVSDLKKDAAFGASRPSFDCARAGQPREKAICSSSELSMLDQHLSLSYRAADYRLADHRQDGAKRMASQKLRASEEEWYATHLKSCQNAECIGPLYRERIQHLDGLK
jgi:hypothetical protein